MEPTHEALGKLLGDLNTRPKDHDARVEAARTALVLCFRLGDPHYADVAEALVADAPRIFPRAKRAELDKLAAQAAATRRAVAMAHRQAHADPSSMAEYLLQDPDRLAREVERRMDAQQPALARAVLEVGLARHKGHSALLELQRSHQDRWPLGSTTDD